MHSVLRYPPIKFLLYPLIVDIWLFPSSGKGGNVVQFSSTCYSSQDRRTSYTLMINQIGYSYTRPYKGFQKVYASLNPTFHPNVYVTFQANIPLKQAFPYDIFWKNNKWTEWFTSFSKSFVQKAFKRFMNHLNLTFHPNVYVTFQANVPLIQTFLYGVLEKKW